MQFFRNAPMNWPCATVRAAFIKVGLSLKANHAAACAGSLDHLCVAACKLGARSRFRLQR
jgi:hypothetical protein